MKKKKIFGIGLTVMLIPIGIIPFFAQNSKSNNKVQNVTDSNKINLNAAGDINEFVYENDFTYFTAVVHLAAIQRDFNVYNCPGIGQE